MNIFILFPFLVANMRDDGELLRRLTEGDAKALAEAYDVYGVLVYRVILRMVSNPGVAEELVQETFLRLWNRANLLDPKSSLGPWIVTIARHRAIDYLRSTSGRIATHQSQLETIEARGVFMVRQDRIGLPQQREIQQAVEKLNENQRSAIELAYYQGMSHTEIAARLNQPLGTVKSWIRTGLRTLRSELEEAKNA